MEWRLFADLAQYTDDRDITVDVASDATVREALDALLGDYPALRERVLEDDAVADHITVLCNGTALAPGELDRSLDKDDELALCPPVSGG